MRRLWLLTVFVLLPTWTHAATYWISPAGTAASCAAADGDDDPGVIGGNTASNSPFYLTASSIDSLNCAAAGDTVVFGSFNFTGTSKELSLIVPSGTSASNRSSIICKGNQTCTISYSTLYNPANASGLLEAVNVDYYRIGAVDHGFLIDCANRGSNSCYGVRLGISGTSNRTDVIIEGSRVVNNTKACVNTAELNPTGGIYTNVTVRYMTCLEPGTPNTSGGEPHGIYLAVNGGLIEYNKVATFDILGSVCIHVYHVAVNITVRNNLCTVYSDATGVLIADNENGQPGNSKIYRNVFRAIPGATPSSCMSFGKDASDASEYYNNVCDGFTNFYNIRPGATGNKIWNNVCGSGTCARVTGSGNDFGGTATVTNPVVTLATHFVDPSAFDYSLKPTSTLINAGIATGLPCNGTCDIGAHESFAPSEASIAVNHVDITLGMNLHTPAIPIGGVGGWTVNCSGTGCGTPTVTSVQLLSGSSTILRLTLSGISGGVCALGQTWTWSFNSTLGAVTDSALIGGTANQTMFSYTTQPITNSCGSGGTTPPGTPHIYWKLDDGVSGTTPTTATDQNLDGGGALNGTLNGGATWTTGFLGSGVNLTTNSSQFISMGYGNGVNPITAGLTVAFSVNVNAGVIALPQSYFGAALGTNQRLYIATRNSTWVTGIQGSSDNSPSSSDLAVHSGWTRVCLNMDNGSGISTLYIDGIASASPGAMKNFTSYTVSSDFTLGVRQGVTNGGGGVFDEFKLWVSPESCADDFASLVPSTSPWTGNLSVVASQAYGAKTVAGVRVPAAAVNTTATVAPDGMIALLFQTDCTNADCSAISQRLYYTCVLCDSAGSDATVPDTATADAVQFQGDTSEFGLLAGDHGALLSGALTRIPGGTNYTADSVPVFDLAQNNSIVNGYVVRFVNAAVGNEYCFFPTEQSGLPLDGYTPSGGLCVTIVPPSATISY